MHTPHMDKHTWTRKDTYTWTYTWTHKHTSTRTCMDRQDMLGQFFYAYASSSGMLMCPALCLGSSPATGTTFQCSDTVMLFPLRWSTKEKVKEPRSGEEKKKRHTATRGSQSATSRQNKGKQEKACVRMRCLVATKKHAARDSLQAVGIIVERILEFHIAN